MSPPVHPTAVVHPEARLATSVRIGPYSVVGKDVEIGEDTELGSHVVIEGPATLGRENRIYPFASLGQAPQDLKFRGERTTLTIGDRNQIREFTTFNRGTAGGGGDTRIGDDNLFMAYTHVAHDCEVGNRVVFANNATLAGHVKVEDHTVLGGMAAIGQFVRLGEGSFVAAGSMVSLDVPPYCLAKGDRAKLFGLNVVGLRRRGYEKGQIGLIENAYRIAFRSGCTLDEACARIRAMTPSMRELQHLADFLEQCSRGVTR